jgi:histidine ammonia-lyase
MFTATQALDFKKPLSSSKTIEKLVGSYRKEVKFIKNDEIMHNHIVSSVKFIESLNIQDNLIV